MSRYNSAELVSAAILLASRITNFEEIELNGLQRDFQVDLQEVKGIAKRMFVFLAEEKVTKLTSCKRKFDQSKFLNVSSMNFGLQNFSLD